MTKKRSRFLAGAALLCCTIAIGLYWALAPTVWQPATWYFNFAPSQAPKIWGFTTIHGKTDYHLQRGYGWLNATGQLSTGRWPPGSSESWESRDNLTLQTRRSPDRLARSFASGDATFALDLEPGEYEVWILTGDAGYREYAPWQPYRILVEEQEIYRLDQHPDQFYQKFSTPPRFDDLSQNALWKNYITPRFPWVRSLVTVDDGQLTIAIDGVPRDRSSSSLSGDYPYTEATRGPRRAYSGAINAVVVTPAQHSERGAASIQRIERWRMRNFARSYKLRKPPSPQSKAPANADVTRGYTIALPQPTTAIYPGSRLPHQSGDIQLRATPGETASFSIAVRPLRELGTTRLALSPLQGPGTADGAVNPLIDIGVVRYQPKMAGGRRWRPQPGMIAATREWHLEQGICKQFWINLKLPDDLPAGSYRSTLTISPQHGPASTRQLELEVLPFQLIRPDHLALGMTYFSPVQEAWFSEERFWQRLTAEFADMRAHGFTTVQYTGIGINDHERMDRLVNIYRDAGFPQPLVLLESYGAMDRLRRDGIPWQSDDFLATYRQQIERLLDRAGDSHWPPLIINFGDEFTNSGMEEFGAKVAQSLKQIPGITTSADANGYKEVSLLAPEVDIVAFNRGWAGLERVNEGKPLLHQGTVKKIRQAGAQAWLVNVGRDRFSNGFWLWKMTRLGVRGKLEWIYRSYSAMPYNPVDDQPMRPQLVYPGPGDTMVHSVNYELMRIGLDDLAYAYTLERLVATWSGDSDSATVRNAADFLAQLDSQIDDDLDAFEANEETRWPDGKYDAMRQIIIGHITALSQAGHQSSRY